MLFLEDWRGIPSDPPYFIWRIGNHACRWLCAKQSYCSDQDAGHVCHDHLPSNDGGCWDTVTSGQATAPFTHARLIELGAASWKLNFQASLYDIDVELSEFCPATITLASSASSAVVGLVPALFAAAAACLYAVS